MRTHEQVEDGVGEAGDQQPRHRDGGSVPAAQRDMSKEGSRQCEQNTVRDARVRRVAEQPYREVVQVGAGGEGDVRGRYSLTGDIRTMAAQERGEACRGVTDEGRH